MDRAFPSTSADIEQISETQLVLNMGPQHPSTHGVLRLLLETEGEQIVRSETDVGYLHRGVEKLIEAHDYKGAITLTDRMDYTSAPANNLGYLMAVEKLLGISDKIPLRARYLRSLVGELSRLAGHHIWIGTHALDLGAMSVFLYALREREKILYLFEQACGARLTTSFMRVGGTGPHDVGEAFIENVEEFLDGYTLREFDDILTDNEIFQQRTRGIGVITTEDALRWGLTGPCLRGSGVAWDLRKARPYAAYDLVEFDVPAYPEGDVYARYRVRLNEMYQAVRIIRQCVAALRALPPQAPSNVLLPQAVPPDVARVPFDMEAMINHFKLVMHGLAPEAGEAYFALESPKGELGYYFVSDGSGKPYRCHVRAPSYVNLGILDHTVRGTLIADVVAIIGSIDIVLGEVDR
ncbi:MAG: NADH dehydrogenase (quinone) subunit D [Armatimonadetes bacterium]|nr:NADH dehydrogenase (quinone) subunit D [Armatimonadota bacterium]MBM4436057.1 NADH dehydrogenase (quinone) subunit D [Actinomycetota bacterium]